MATDNKSFGGPNSGYVEQPPAYTYPQGYPPVGHGYPAPHSQLGYGQPMPQYPPPMQSAQQQQSTVVVMQQPQPSTVVVGLLHRDYFASAIFVTIFCCFPFGIAAIVSAINAREHSRQLDIDEANKWSNRAKWFVIASVLCGLVWIITVIAVRVTQISYYSY